MKGAQYVGMVWVVLGIFYGVGGTLVNQPRWWITGAALYAIVAVTTTLWTSWLPDDPA